MEHMASKRQSREGTDRGHEVPQPQAGSSGESVNILQKQREYQRDDRKAEQRKQKYQRYNNSEQGKRRNQRANLERRARRYGQVTLPKGELELNKKALDPDTRPGEEGVLSFDTKRTYIPAKLVREELARGRAAGEQEHDPKMKQAIREIEEQSPERDDKKDEKYNELS